MTSAVTEHIEKQIPLHFDYPELTVMLSFVQVFSSTTGGMGGVGGCAITQAPVHVVIGAAEKQAVVFFAGQVAYDLDFVADEPGSHRLLSDCLHQCIIERPSYRGEYAVSARTREGR